MTVLTPVLRQHVYPLLLRCGVDQWLQQGSSDRLILAYHGVTACPDFSFSNNPMATDQFRKHLQYLKQRFDLVTLDEIAQPHRGKKKRIAITFDDGYTNNYTEALPLLAELQIPATVFVIGQIATDETRISWYDRFNLYVYALRESGLRAEEVLFTSDIAQYRTRMKQQSAFEKEQTLQQLLQAIPHSEMLMEKKQEQWQLMNAQQLRLLSSSPWIQIGSHTQTHPNLASRSEEEIQKEVCASKRAIEQVIGKGVHHIAYPDGSYDERVIRICREAGYTLQLAVERRPGIPHMTDVLPRYSVSNTTTYAANMLLISRAFHRFGF